MNPLTKHLQPIFDDNTSGSGEILRQLMDAIYYMTEDDGISIGEEFPKKLIRVCLPEIGHFAIVVHFLNALFTHSGDNFSAREVVRFLEEYRTKWKEKGETLASHLKSVQPLKNQNFMLHSNSSSVIDVLGQISANEEGRNTTVFQSISHPKKEGLIQGRKLMDQGWKIIFIEDAVMGKMLTQCDFVLLGSDVISASTFVNKTGTMSLVAAAHLLKVPVYILGDERKLIDENSLPEWLDAKLMNESPRSSEELGLENGEKGLNYYFEHTPTSWLNGVIMHTGIYTPQQIIEKAEDHKFSQEFLDLTEKMK